MWVKKKKNGSASGANYLHALTDGQTMYVSKCMSACELNSKWQHTISSRLLSAEDHRVVYWRPSVVNVAGVIVRASAKKERVQTREADLLLSGKDLSVLLYETTVCGACKVCIGSEPFIEMCCERGRFSCRGKLKHGPTRGWFIAT